MNNDSINSIVLNDHKKRKNNPWDGERKKKRILIFENKIFASQINAIVD